MDEVIDRSPLAFAGMIGSASAYVVSLVCVVLAAVAPTPQRAAGARGRRVARVERAPIVVRVDANAPLDALYSALESVCGDSDDECVFVFGHAKLSLPRTAVRIECAGAPPMDGFIVRGKGLHDRLLADVHARQWALLMWADGQLWLTHPSGPGRGPLPDEPVDLATDFFPKDDGKLGEVLPAFGHAADVLALVIVWLRSD